MWSAWKVHCSLQHPDANARNNPACPQYRVQTNSNHWLFFNAAVTHPYSGLCRACANHQEHSCNFSFKIRQEEQELGIKPWLLKPLTVQLKRPIWFFLGHVSIVAWRGAMIFSLFGRGIRKDYKDFLIKNKTSDLKEKKHCALHAWRLFTSNIIYSKWGMWRTLLNFTFLPWFLVPCDFFSSWFSWQLIMQFLQEHLI